MYQIKSKIGKFKLPKLDNITIAGYSRSKYRTGYLIQPYNIYLDAGLPSPIPPNLILLSHSHLDHNASLYSLLVEGTKTPVMLPEKDISSTQTLLNSFSSLNSGKQIKYNNWIPIKKSNYELVISKKKLIINSYNLDHSVPCLAYSIDVENSRLKEEYKDYEGHQLGEMRRSGIDITEKYLCPMLLFVSDTGKSILETLPFNNYPIIIIECTFFEEEHYEDAVKKKHLHWNDLEPFVKENPNSTFILGHFSCKYSDEYLTEKEESIKKDYNNIIFWL